MSKYLHNTQIDSDDYENNLRSSTIKRDKKKAKTSSLNKGKGKDNKKNKDFSSQRKLKRLTREYRYD